jgi:hypothetical protein
MSINEELEMSCIVQVAIYRETAEEGLALLVE